MSRGTRPLPPWYSPATRRLALVRIGLPTLFACLLATGPAAATQAEHMMPPRAAALVANVTTAARQALDPPPPSRDGLRGDAPPAGPAADGAGPAPGPRGR